MTVRRIPRGQGRPPSRRRLPRPAVATGLLLTAVVLVAQAALGATAAEARCSNGTPVLPFSTVGSIPGAPVANETPDPGTCNNNGTYTGKLHVTTTTLDINFIELWVQDNGAWRLIQHTNDGQRKGVPFTILDNNNRTVWMTLCWEEQGLSAQYHCGWGTSIAAAGQNPGTNGAVFNQPQFHGVNSGF